MNKDDRKQLKRAKSAMQLVTRATSVVARNVQKQLHKYRPADEDKPEELALEGERAALGDAMSYMLDAIELLDTAINAEKYEREGT